ncbi:MAG TPA: TetR-like C-terminal domain-containing protein [Acidimicrobiales bacterium]
MTETAQGTPCSVLGRPRNPEVDRAIAAATLELLAEHGFAGVTVEAVAAVAGVAKSTVYRRYPSRLELLIGVIRHELAEPKGEVDSGTVVGDLALLGRRLVVGLTQTSFGRALPAILSATAAHPELHEVRLEFVSSRRAPAVAAVRRAIDRGELRADADPEQVVDVLSGPVFYRVFVKGETVDEAWIDAHAESVVRAFAPQDSGT